MSHRVFFLQQLSFLSMVVSCLLAFAYSFGFLQFYLGLLPCSLCTLERFIVGSFFISNLVALLLLQKERINRLIAPLIANTVIISLGIYIAIHHVILQYLPSDDITCFVSLGVEQQHNFFINFIESLSQSSDCSVIDFVMFGLSISAQVLIVFSIWALVVLVQWYLWIKSFLDKRKSSL